MEAERALFRISRNKSRIHEYGAAFVLLLQFAFLNMPVSAETQPEQIIAESSAAEQASKDHSSADKSMATNGPAHKINPSPSNESAAKQESPSQNESVSASARVSVSTADDLGIERWDFGVVTERNGATKNWKLHPVVVVPNLPGVQYAWKLKLKNQDPVFVREVFTLPEPPSMWKIKEGEAASELTEGGQQCILESFQPTDDGWLGHAWTISHGDPAGRYEIKIWLSGKLAHVFTFNVGEAAASGKEARDW